MVGAEKFLAYVEQIAVEEPAYKLGHDGSDGYCDCIGLIIGAIRRAGGQWRGIHGSNYAARSEITRLSRIGSASELAPGEAVFKACEPGTGGYNLPDRYDPGGQGYNGDLNDYYHVGVVVSVDPLRIRHMTTPKPKMDTKLGKWSHHGRLKKIDYSGGGGKVDKVIISGGNPEAPVNMRKAPSTGSAIVAKIPQGSEAELISSSGAWSEIRCSGQSGYVMASFVHPSGDPMGETVTVSRTELERAYDILGDMLGLRG